MNTSFPCGYIEASDERWVSLQSGLIAKRMIHDGELGQAWSSEAWTGSGVESTGSSQLHWRRRCTDVLGGYPIPAELHACACCKAWSQANASLIAYLAVFVFVAKITSCFWELQLHSPRVASMIIAERVTVIFCRPAIKKQVSNYLSWMGVCK